MTTRSTGFDPGEPDDPELPEGEVSEYLLSYTLTVGDIVFTGKEISSVSAGFSSSDMGMSGISTFSLNASCLLTSFSRAAAANLTVGTPVIFSAEGFGGFPPLYLGSVNISYATMSVTAYDKTFDIDMTFDAEQFPEYSTNPQDVDANGNPKKILYPATQVLNACTGQAGIGSCTVPGLPALYRSEFAGKTIRQILTDMSQVGVGVFCMVNGSVNFVQFASQGPGSIGVLPGDSSEVYSLGNKSIMHAFITDSVYSQTYEYGNSSQPGSGTVSLTGAYFIGEDICDGAASRLMANQYKGWKCDSAIISSCPTYGAAFGGGYVYECSINFGATEIVASLGAPAPPMGKGDFRDRVELAIAEKIQANETYGSTSIDLNNGLTIMYEELTQNA